jgi:hypothetical protein
MGGLVVVLLPRGIDWQQPMNDAMMIAITSDRFGIASFRRADCRLYTFNRQTRIRHTLHQGSLLTSANK